jgi:thiamine pyrophosphate-dependent acetolactate synthase large subunit-like protein
MIVFRQTWLDEKFSCKTALARLRIDSSYIGRIEGVCTYVTGCDGKTLYSFSKKRKEKKSKEKKRKEKKRKEKKRKEKKRKEKKRKEMHALYV